MPKDQKVKKKYSEDELLEPLLQLVVKMAKATTIPSKKFSIPVPTLHYKLSGKYFYGKSHPGAF